MNNITVVGRLRVAPVLKTVTVKDEERKVCELSIVSSRQGTNNEVDFFNVAIWNGRGEAAHKHLIKGQLISISGTMRQDRWTDAQGHAHNRWTLVASDTEWLNKPRSAERPNPDPDPEVGVDGDDSAGEGDES